MTNLSNTATRKPFNATAMFKAVDRILIKTEEFNSMTDDPIMKNDLERVYELADEIRFEVNDFKDFYGKEFYGDLMDALGYRFERVKKYLKIRRRNKA